MITISTTMSQAVVLDSSGLISLLNATDALHQQAVAVSEILAKPTWHLLLPPEVLAETVNVFGRHGGRQVAADVAALLLEQHAAGELVITDTDPRLMQHAAELQGTAKGAPSFIDCLVMAVAERFGTSYVFGFDATFRKNGYRVPELNGTKAQAA